MRVRSIIRMRSGSRLHSLLSPAKQWPTSQRRRRYGFLLNNLLLDKKGGEKLTRKSLEDRVDVPSNPFQNLGKVEKIIGYSFNDRSLLHQAFTHQSYHTNLVSYERLEYVGDSILNLLITKEQFSMYPDLPPGFLTPLRAANVDTEKLARVAIKHNFHNYILHGKPIIENRIRAFVKALPRYPVHSHGLLDAPKVLADVVESTIGAIFIDTNSSIDATWEVAKRLLEPLITPETLQTNPVKKLYEICQKNKLKVRVVDRWSKEGAYEVFINNELRGRGGCRLKKEVALNRAADVAYNEVIKTLDMKLE